MKRVFIGFKENSIPNIFESEITPNKETHPLYDFIHGPFKSKEDAVKYVKATTGLACGDS